MKKDLNEKDLNDCCAVFLPNLPHGAGWPADGGRGAAGPVPQHLRRPVAARQPGRQHLQEPSDEAREGRAVR